MQKKLCNADMAEEYFSHTYYYTESCVDAVREAELVTGDGVLKDFDEVPYRCWESHPDWEPLKYRNIENGLWCWIEC